MARIRTIKPEILEDARTAGLSDPAFRLFIALIVLADDHGGVRADDRWLDGQVWWARGGSRNSAASLGELSEADLVVVYDVRGQRYASIRSWSKHQRIDNASKPRVPQPSDPEAVVSRNFAANLGETRLDPDLRPPITDPDKEPAADRGPSERRKARPSAGATPAAHKPAIEAFDAYYRDTHNDAKPTWNSKTVGMLKQLCSKHGADEVVRRIDVLRDSPPQWPIGPWDLATFVQHFDKCAGGSPSGSTRFIPRLA